MAFWIPIAIAAAAAAGAAAKGAGSNKLLQKQYFPGGIDKLLNPLATRFKSDLALGDTAIKDYTARTGLRAADAARLGKLAETDYGTLVSRGLAPDYDPRNVYSSVLKENLGAYRDFGTDAVRNAVNKARMSLGLSGGRSSSYTDLLTSKGLGSQVGNIIAGASPATAGILAGRLANAEDIRNAIAARTGTAYEGEGLELLPALGANALTGGSIANARDIFAAARGNTAGFVQDQNVWDRIGNSLTGLAGTLGSLYGSGALGSIGTGASTAASSLPAANTLSADLANYARGGLYQPAFSGYGVSYGAPAGSPYGGMGLSYGAAPGAVPYGYGGGLSYYQPFNYAGR